MKVNVKKIGVIAAIIGVLGITWSAETYPVEEDGVIVCRTLGPVHLKWMYKIPICTIKPDTKLHNIIRSVFF